jgi:hypothetical protein
MSNRMRSADWMVRAALDDPARLEALRRDPEAALKALAAEATRQLPEPSAGMTDYLWLIVVASFALVMLGSAYVIGTTVTAEAKTGTTYITRSETLVTIFTTAVAFLAGLLSPSPVRTR